LQRRDQIIQAMVSCGLRWGRAWRQWGGVTT
jgi:hypothetical protein